MAEQELTPGTPAVNQDAPCPHGDFAVDVGIQRLVDRDDGPVVAYIAEIKVHCAQCGEPFRWSGVHAGLHPGAPRCSVDETELRAPMRPASADPDFGLGIPGFAIRQVT